jgi:hypothetical protein
MTTPRRSPWLTDRAALLVKFLEERHGLTVPEDAARHDVSGHLDYIAEMMRIGRQAAKMYVTDDVLSDMADRIAAAVNRHPGSSTRRNTRGHGLVDLDAERRRRR